VNDCYEYIDQLFRSKKLDELVSKIDPIDLQNDLKQELAIILLKYDCDKIKGIIFDGKFIGFVNNILWNLATQSNNVFVRTYRKHDIDKAIEYLNSLQNKEIIGAEIAEKHLNKKMSNSAKDAHEAIIFRKYVECRNMKEVAKYFNIPHKHVFIVVTNVKKELKERINERI
jgi:uncharacterized protein with HEPN domain